MPIHEVFQGIFAIDLYEEGKPARSSAYVILDDQPTLVETGSTRSHSALVEGLKELGLTPVDLQHVIITHVHLDHAGGVGPLMEKAENATLYCHPRAARHVIDPSRLESGARMVYGDGLEQIFGPLKPVPASRVQPVDDQFQLPIGRHTLTFYDTPGHARHHCCVVDDLSRGIFSGDMLGIRYAEQYTGWPFVYGMPSTTPSDFNPAVMRATLARLQKLDLARVFHTHFGLTKPAREAFDFSRRGLDVIERVVQDLSSEPNYQEIHALLTSAIQDDIRELGYAVDNVNPLSLDIWLNSQGILVYLQKLKAGKL